MVIVQFEKIYNKGRIQDVVIGRSRTLAMGTVGLQLQEEKFSLKKP